MRLYVFSLLGMGLTGFGAASGENPPHAYPPPVSIETLVSEALRDHPECRIYEAEIISAQGAFDSSGKWANPELDVSYGQKSVSGTGNEDGPSWSVSLSQSFDWPGRNRLRKALAEHDLAAAELALRQFQNELVVRVKMAAQTLVLAGEKEQLARSLAGKWSALHEILAQRSSAGIAQQIELQLVEAGEQSMRRNVIAAERDTKTARQELNLLRGQPPTSPVVIMDSLPRHAPLPPPDELVAGLRKNNLDLKAQDLQIKQATSRFELAGNERYPSIDVAPFFAEEDAGDRERTIGVGVSLPLPLWNRNRGNVMSASADQWRAESALEHSQRTLESRVLNAAADYESSLAKQALWGADGLNHYREAAETAERHYRLGSVSLNLYLEMLEHYSEAIDQWYETEISAVQTLGELEMLTGLSLVSAQSNKELP